MDEEGHTYRCQNHEERLKKIEEALHGNGHEGILIKLDRLIVSGNTQKKLLWMIMAIIVGTYLPKLLLSLDNAFYQAYLKVN